MQARQETFCYISYSGLFNEASPKLLPGFRFYYTKDEAMMDYFFSGSAHTGWSPFLSAIIMSAAFAWSLTWAVRERKTWMIFAAAFGAMAAFLSVGKMIELAIRDHTAVLEKILESIPI